MLGSLDAGSGEVPWTFPRFNWKGFAQHFGPLSIIDVGWYQHYGFHRKEDGSSEYVEVDVGCCWGYGTATEHHEVVGTSMRGRDMSDWHHETGLNGGISSCVECPSFGKVW